MVILGRCRAELRTSPNFRNLQWRGFRPAIDRHRSANAVSGYSFIIAILRLRDAVGSCAEVEAQRHPKTGANINAVL
jgi:hypothetical protein